MSPATQNGKRKAYYGFVQYADLGLRFALAIAIGVGGGYWLDTRMHTMPLFVIVGLFLGAASGFLTIYRAVYSQKDTKDKQGE